MPIIKNYIQKLTSKSNSKTYILIILTTFVAKFLGLIKQPFLISRLGVQGSDLLLSSDKLSQIITGFLVAGTIYSSLLPVFTKFYTNQKSEYQKFIKLTGFLTVSIIAIISIFCWLFIHQIIPFILDEQTLKNLLSTNQYSNFILATRALLVIPTLMTLQTVLGVYLNLNKRVFWFNFSGLITNIAILVGLILFDNYWYIAIFSLVGWVVSNIIILLDSLHCGLRFDKSDFNILNILNNIKKYHQELKQISKLIISKIFLLDLTTLALVLIVPFKQFDGQIAAFDLGITLQNSLLFLMLNYNYIIFPQLSVAYHKNISPKFFQNSLPRLIKINILIALLAIISTIILSVIIIFILGKTGKINNLGSYIQNVVILGLPTILFASLKDIVLKQLQILKDIKISQILNLISLFIFSFMFFVLHKFFTIDSGYSLIFSLNLAYLPWLYYLIKTLKP